MIATSGGIDKTISAYTGAKRESGSASFTGTYSISGNNGATKSIAVTFKNYNTDENKSSTKSINLSVTVPAWTSYPITYNANGGSGAPSSQKKWKDQTLILSTTKPTKTGNSFTKWNTKNDGTGTSYNAGGAYTTNAAATLYAQWKAITYTVKYDANGGTGAPSPGTKTYGVIMTLSDKVPTRTGYTFLGWSTSSTATASQYSRGGKYTANASITLYAVWQPTLTKPEIFDVELYRCSVSGGKKDDGNYARFIFTYRAQDYVNITLRIVDVDGNEHNARRYRDDGYGGHDWFIHPDELPILDLEHDIPEDFVFDTNKTYSFVLTISEVDGDYTTEITLTLPSAIFTIDALAGGNGVAFGKSAELEGYMDVGFKTMLRGGLEYIVLPSGTDLDEQKTPGFYAGQNVSNEDIDYPNCPAISGTFTLEVASGGPNGQTHQRLSVCDKNKPAVYERWFYTNSWGDWYGGWIYPSLSSAFVEYGSDSTSNAVRYRKDGRMVEIRGIVKPIEDIPGSTTGHTIFSLPTGYRPSSPVLVVCQGSNACVWLLTINPGGDVSFSRYRDHKSTDNFTTATTGNWLPFQATFFADQ
jgi:uncharacterized repeat protein (TIGR02543 family)